MGSIGIIFKNTLHLTSKLPRVRHQPGPSQERVLRRLLRRAQDTMFGREYNFSRILRSGDVQRAFSETVPIHTYETIENWWKLSLQGEHSVCWPGKVDYFALSSGTSTGSSKYIPVTRTMLKAIQRGSINQLLSLAHVDLPEDFFEKNILMLGGSTNLDYNGIYYAGDLSGITTGNLPFWFQPFYKPGRYISRTKDWQEKLNHITQEAHKWDVSAIVGVPSWFQLLMERIIEYNKVDNIHEVWPNLIMFVHGGVAFEPYKKSFQKLLGKPLVYMETYLASEGFVAYQDHPNAEGMKMLYRNGIYFEFIPINDRNLDADGNVRQDAQTLTIDQVEEGVDYAILLSTCAGAWRYVIGDVVRFTNKEEAHLRITGRTKHYLSLCGEHLSVENMNRAIELVSDELNMRVKEFTVAGEPYQNVFAHHWFISAENGPSEDIIRDRLDYHLKQLNDDYRTERMHALREVIVDRVPNQLFLEWLKSQGKEGAQIKFPRVLKKEQLQNWKNFLAQKQQAM